MPPSVVEGLESIDQMRIVESGGNVISVPVEESLPSVNEPHEADLALDYIWHDAEQRSLLERILI